MYPLKTKTKYDPNNLPAIWTTYTTVYLGNYVSGDFDEGSGSHCGVDIVPMIKNDTVFSVLDGTVTFAGAKAADGNSVVVKHENVPDPDDFSKTTTLYSVYLHLDSLSVSTGDRVKEGDILGKSGNTGNSTGEHLHFQIDRAEAPFHPYWPFSMGEASEAGLGFMEAVNRGLGIEKARKYTTNPLVYLDAVALKQPNNSSEAPIKPVVKPVAKPEVVVPPVVVPEVRTPEVVVPPVVVKPEAVEIAARIDTIVSFTDVLPSHPYAEAIAFVKDRGIASGSNGTFRPDAPVTRAEILKMAFNASGKSISSDTKSYFSDIAPNSWPLPYVNTARELRAVSGYPDGTFRPNAAVTRAEALKIVLVILSVTPDEVSFPVYTDVATNLWYAPYAAWAKASGIFDTETFSPNHPASRGEVAAIIFAAMTA